MSPFAVIPVYCLLLHTVESKKTLDQFFSGCSLLLLVVV